MNAPGATARMLSMMAESLPIGAELDMIVSTPVVFSAMGSCADIISQNWDIDTYCQDPERKEVMVQWKNRRIHAAVRQVDEEGADQENAPFLKLSLLEAIQAVKNGMEDQIVLVGAKGTEDDR
jgi:hypothetical protein